MGTTILAFILVLGLLIFIHELGHFAVAKYCGVGVEVFSLGFGPRLIGFTSGETEYKLCAVPFGGYVKMVGESPGETAEDSEYELKVAAEEETAKAAEGELSDEEKLKRAKERALVREQEHKVRMQDWKRKSFTLKPLKSRVAIVAAGATVNIVFALMLYPITFMIGVNTPAYKEAKVVVGLVAPDEAAFKAGLKAGDVILSVDGVDMPKYETFLMTAALSPEKDMLLRVSRAGTIIETTLTPETSELGAGLTGFYPPVKPVVDKVYPDSAAEKAGLKSGDWIKAIDGNSIKHWVELQMAIHESGALRVLTVERDGVTLDVSVTPDFNEEHKIHLIGVTPYEETVLMKYGVVESIGRGMSKATEMTVLLFTVLKKLFVGDLSGKALGGPIMIAQISGQAAQSGLVSMLTFLAFLSLQLGILNLLPIPVLDGGHLFFYAIEFVRRGKAVSERVMGMAQQVGMAMILTLMVYVTYND